MKLDALVKSLDEIGVKSVKQGDIKRWAYTEKIIFSVPQSNERTKKGGRGWRAEWPEATLEQAAAVWAVRREAPRLSAKEVLKVRGIALFLFASPQAEYSVSSPSGLRFTAPEPLALYDYRSLKLQLRNAEKLDRLARAWFVAFVKARNREHIDSPFRIELPWHSSPCVDLGREEPEEKVSIHGMLDYMSSLPPLKRLAAKVALLQQQRATSCTTALDEELSGALSDRATFRKVAALMDEVTRDLRMFQLFGHTFELEEPRLMDFPELDGAEIVILIDGVDMRKRASFYFADASITPERRLQRVPASKM